MVIYTEYICICKSNTITTTFLEWYFILTYMCNGGRLLNYTIVKHNYPTYTLVSINIYYFFTIYLQGLELWHVNTWFIAQISENIKVCSGHIFKTWQLYFVSIWGTTYDGYKTNIFWQETTHFNILFFSCFYWQL